MPYLGPFSDLASLLAFRANVEAVRGDDGGTPAFDATASNKDAQHWLQGDSHGDIVAGVNL
jgi:hypothetical protein